jgi:hypothetical protein
MPRSIISFGFEDSFADSFDEGLEAGTAFKGLTNTISQMKTFLLAETEAGTEAEAGAGTRGTETETAVTLAVETFGIVGTVGTEAGTIGIAGIIGTAGTAGIETGTGVGIALGIEAFSSCARLNKNSR